MILTVLIFMYCSFLCEKMLTFYVFFFFLAYFKTGSCCNLEILWIQDSKGCIITIKENGKRRIWDGTVFERIY